ncbi:MAG TPA: hypothetical protein VKX49_09770 [Bryobacteraceae bacterium]|nr:hypothetical protein [Bryobacteraceae bacterium]
MPAVLDNIAFEFRSAVLAGDHVLAARRVSEYAAAVAQLWETLTQEERAASELPAQVRELLSWARGMAIVQRVIAAEQLAILQKASRYGVQQAATAHSLVEVSL